jgi:hypothetical protein
MWYPLFLSIHTFKRIKETKLRKTIRACVALVEAMSA